MKAAIVTDYMPGLHEGWSGAELIAKTLGNMLTKEGCGVQYLTSKFDNPKYAKGITQVATPLRKLGPLSRNFPLDIICTCDLYRKLKSIDPDIVHINAKYLLMPAFIASKILRKPVVFTVPDYFILCPTTFIRRPDGSECKTYHGSDCTECSYASGGFAGKIVNALPAFVFKAIMSARARLFNRVIKAISSFVVLSNESKRRLQMFGINEERIKLVYHYEVSEPACSSSNVGRHSIGFAGWLSKENGTDMLLRMFKMVKERIEDSVLYLIGSGSDEFIRQLKDYIAENGLERSVWFLGKMQNDDTLSYLSQCDVVVVPHQWPKEFGPVVLIEAMAMGRPVVTSRCGATWEFIEDGRSGYLIEDYRTEDGFADKVSMLLSDDALRNRIGSEARKAAGLMLNGKQSKNMISLYESLIVAGG